MSGAVAFGAIIVAAALAGRYGRPAAVLLAAVSVASLPLNHSMEGRTLYTLSHDHGITAGDLVSLLGFVLAAVMWFFPRPD